MTALETLSEIFEIFMVLLFGASWPFNIARAYRAKTAKGTSLVFTLLIAIGYVCAIISKLCAYAVKGAEYFTPLRILAFVFYIINLTMLIIAIAIYFRNKKLDSQKSDLR